MGIDVTFEVWCDGDDCGEWAAVGRSKKSAPGEAEKIGWVRRKRKWLCPRHARKAALDEAGVR